MQLLLLYILLLPPSLLSERSLFAFGSRSVGLSEDKVVVAASTLPAERGKRGRRTRRC